MNENMPHLEEDQAPPTPPPAPTDRTEPPDVEPDASTPAPGPWIADVSRAGDRC